ncbi:Fur family transcriptional regulator [Leptolyngbya sp. PCC 6406]|uniref:Fur family transcriptional regulator n=1 Tax=Leptolyngbya sp. PCC 6406 TaxID=1173264 RepID=UPI0002E3453F|nr:Fur family transcriptional regulator [Leptolyngbya sp. PCC 6406]
MIIVLGILPYLVMNGDSVQSNSHPLPELGSTDTLTDNQALVLTLLGQQSIALSAQELHALIQEQRPIGLATVYRALDTLNLLGLIQRRVGQRGESFYSVASPEQSHLTCLRCGHSLPVVLGLEPEWAAQLNRVGMFQIYYYTLEFFGLCDSCSPSQN